MCTRRKNHHGRKDGGREILRLRLSRRRRRRCMSAQGNALGGFDGSFSGALKGRGESVWWAIPYHLMSVIYGTQQLTSALTGRSSFIRHSLPGRCPGLICSAPLARKTTDTAVTLYIKLWSNVETPGAGDNVTRSAYCAARAKLCFVVRISMPARGGFVAAEMEHLRSVR